MKTESTRAAWGGALKLSTGEVTTVKKNETGKVKLALAPRPTPKHNELDSARRGIYDAISLLQSTIEEVASEAFIFYDSSRTLSAKRRNALLDQESCATAGLFEERQCAVLEGAEQLRGRLSDIVDLSEMKEALSFIMTLRDCARSDSKDRRNRAHRKGDDAFLIAAQIMFVWSKLLRLCDLDDLPALAFSADSPDLVAAAATLTVPTEDRMNEILACGTTCVALLKDFCGYRGIETR